MAQWHTFTHPDTFRPELLVGLYDCWVRSVPGGTTQAERWSVHTPMLELAHERRFALSQARRKLDSFEATHCQHLRYALDSLTRYYDQHSSDEHELHMADYQSSLLGMSQQYDDSTQYDSSIVLRNETHGEIVEGITEDDPVNADVRLDVMTQHAGCSLPGIHLDDNISVDENEDDTDVAAILVQAAQEKRHAHGARCSKRPRQLAHLKVRKAHPRGPNKSLPISKR